MLSVSGIGSAGGAAEYYGKDDYYVSGEAGEPGATWGGKGAAAAGLSGTADTKDFREVLDGSHAMFGSGANNEPKADPSGGKPAAGASPGDAPSGKSPKQPEPPSKADGVKHRPGWDLTFSAPKSVSVAVLVGGDKRLEKAHDQAVATAMDYIERTMSVTRIREPGGKIQEKITGNLVYASVKHITSRAGDPQLHTHNVVANATFDHESGKVRALESRQIYKHMKLAGKIYQRELGAHALGLGYNVRRDRATGTIELADWERSTLQGLSKRNTQIREAIEVEKQRTGGELSPAQKERLVLKDRPKKLAFDRSEIFGRWKTEAKEAGIDAAAAVGRAQERGRGQDVTPQRTGVANDVWARITDRLDNLVRFSTKTGSDFSEVASVKDAVKYGIQVTERGQAVFTKHEAISTAYDIARVGPTLSAVEKELGNLQATGRIQQADKTLHTGITTDSALALERTIVQRLENGRGAGSPIMSKKAAEEGLSPARTLDLYGVALNRGQTEAALTALTSSDRYIGVQGLAGVGKTTMFKAVRGLGEEAGADFVGLTPTHAAAKAMTAEAGIEANTLESWLNGRERALSQKPEVVAAQRKQWEKKTLLVDESSMTSNWQMDRLTTAVERLGIQRVILIGDEKQLGSPEAGAPWRLLLNEKITHAKMTEIRRQRDPEVRSAVENLAKGAALAAFRTLGNRVVEVGRDANDDKLALAAFESWKSVQAEGRDAPVIVPTHSLRGKVADHIRQDLVQQGRLGPTAYSHERLSPVRMTPAESYRAANFREGQLLVFHSGDRAAKIRPDATLSVVGRDEKSNTLFLESDKGVRHKLNLNPLRENARQKFQTYMRQDTEVRQGENMAWDRLDAQRGFQVGAPFTVEKITETEWTIRQHNGERLTLPANDPALRFVSHNYAITADRSQGSTYQDVVAVLSSKHGEAATMARAYVQVSRTSETVSFVTNDVKLLAMKVGMQTGENRIALDELVSDMAQIKAAEAALPEKDAALEGADKPNELAARAGADTPEQEVNELAVAAGAEKTDEDSDALAIRAGADPNKPDKDDQLELDPAKARDKGDDHDKAHDIASPTHSL